MPRGPTPPLSAHELTETVSLVEGELAASQPAGAGETSRWTPTRRSQSAAAAKSPVAIPLRRKASSDPEVADIAPAELSRRQVPFDAHLDRDVADGILAADDSGPRAAGELSPQAPGSKSSLRPVSGTTGSAGPRHRRFALDGLRGRVTFV
jgi:hypothetical protein